MNSPKIALLVLALGATSGLASPSMTGAPAPVAEETVAEKDLRMKWWREARFGLFIHWGLYAVPAGTWNGQQIPGIGEWIMLNGKIPVTDYAKFAERFNPVKFDARAWVRLAKQAGMKYIVITSKHHDGFAMFHSAASPYNVYDATPFKRDPLKELAAACQAEGVKLGFYYSQAQDWHHAGGAARGGSWDPAQAGNMDDYLRQVAYPQVKEILTQYGPIAILWWDTPYGMDAQRAALLAPLIKLQPGIITNNRLGGGYMGDTETPEQNVPATGYPRDWEACMTINDTWGFKSYDTHWKSTETLVRHLVDIASKGGNYLLNVGPTAEGEIPAACVERLEQIGVWLKTNGEAVYGTTASPFKRLEWGRATQKPGKLYLHVFDWPRDGLLTVPMSTGASTAHLLAAPDRPLAFTPSPAGLQLRVPASPPDATASVIVLEGVGTVQALLPPPWSSGGDGVFHLKCDAGDLIGPGLRIEGNTRLNLTGWHSTEAQVQWQIQVARATEYDVVLLAKVLPDEAGGAFRLTVGATELTGTVPATTGEEYQEIALGHLSLPANAAVDVTLQATEIPGEEFLKFRELVLRPRDQGRKN